MVDCDTVDGGCNGGLMENAFQWLADNGGIMAQDDYPYTAQGGDCQFDSGAAKVQLSGFNKLDTQDEEEIATYLSETGPLSVAINAEPLQYYEGGVYNPDESECDPAGLDHGVAIVGYGNEDGQDFWIVRNSWGASWGEEGYFRIAKGTGACGINTDVSSAILA